MGLPGVVSADLSRRVRIDGRFIVLDDTGQEYDIALERCRTWEQITAWTLHLSEKDWVSKAMLRQFVQLAMAGNGLPWPAMG